MAYQTILAHLLDERGLATVLPPALRLAHKFDAHLKGLAVLPALIVEPSLTPGGAGTTVIESHRKAFAEEYARMGPAFDVAARDAGVRAERVLDDANPWPVWRKVAEHARVSDLTIIAQGDTSFAVAAMSEGAEGLVMQTGRPVLIVPERGDHAQTGRRIVVAWNGGREAARAAFDALPLLKRAESVMVLSVTPDDRAEAGDVPAADLATALARHKVKCEAAESVRRTGGVGATLLAAVEEAKADLLVMGCYGHSRLRELILGGATRHVLSNMKVPVLMSH